VQHCSELSVGEVYRHVTQRLRSAKVESPQLDARVLTAHVLGCAPEELIRYDRQVLDERSQLQLFELIERRIEREPVAYLVGEKEFWSHTFFVEPGVLIPRPDTETIIEAILNAVVDRKKPLSILDLGTGTGCILITLLKELPHAVGVGVDISEVALGIAAKNAIRHGVSDRISWISSDWLGNVNGSFDIIVANPPYIDVDDYRGLGRSVRDFEPQVALVGGTDGLGAYREICKDVTDHLKTEGTIYLEIGHRQAADVSQLLRANSMIVVDIVKDLSQNDRCVVARLNNNERKF